MKNLNEYPTPITRELFELYRQRAAMPWELQPMFEDLERKLAACRDILACVNSSQILPDEIHSEISQTLAATEP